MGGLWFAERSSCELNASPKNLTPTPHVKVTLFGNEVFADVSKLNEVLLDSGGS